MCLGEIGYETDGYYEDWAREQERREQERQAEMYWYQSQVADDFLRDAITEKEAQDYWINSGWDWGKFENFALHRIDVGGGS